MPKRFENLKSPEEVVEHMTNEGVNDAAAAEAAGVDLLPGDSIVKAGTTRVECLDYDATVDALMALPPAPAPAGLMAVWRSTSRGRTSRRWRGASEI